MRSPYLPHQQLQQISHDPTPILHAMQSANTPPPITPSPNRRHVRTSALYAPPPSYRNHSGPPLPQPGAIRTARPASVHAVVSYLQSKGLLSRTSPASSHVPSILTADVRAHLSPVFAFLSRDLRVPGPDIRRVVNKCPRLLTASVRDRLRPNLLFLHRLGFTDQTALAYRDPILLVASVENTLMPKLDYLASLGLSRDEAAAMVRRCPGLFTFSIEKNFKPKYEYFAQAMGGSAGELKEFPQYFAFSLEKRIKPRHVKWWRRGEDAPRGFAQEHGCGV
ncbi:hypothetical protein ACMD2_25002 [Ananas comosus]|uniref:Transcription termination factor MTEF1, chloroplastic n=1 Tax=Ananas comosus TaxID=4615 RepID=A0A199UZD9_ANACO|nr:hypothetical protein ACMD2_25002 [Ananas comosus]